MKPTLPFGVFRLLFGLGTLIATAPAQETALAAPADNAELAQIYHEDQADRQPETYRKLGRTVIDRDKQRLDRTMEIYHADGLKTGADYLHAAMIMQHGGTTEYYLLAHEFCMAALALGHDRARWLSAASYDRLLKSLGRPQRFGTQYGSKVAGGPQELYQIDDNVRDSLRQILRVPTLAESKAREADMTKRYMRSTKPTLDLATFSASQPAPAEFDVLDLTAGDTAPEILESSAPVFPEPPLAEKTYGWVMLSGVIERDGTLTQPQVAHATQEAFGPAALAAIASWKFKPGMKQGQPARVIVVIKVHFVPPAAK